MATFHFAFGRSTDTWMDLEFKSFKHPEHVFAA